MGCFGLKFHHLGLAVRSPESARSFIEGQGYHIGDTVFELSTKRQPHLVRARKRAAN